MRVVCWIKGERGVLCLQRLLESPFAPVALILQPQQGKDWHSKALALAQEAGIACLGPEDPNTESTRDHLAAFETDVFVLAGYGKILSQGTIDIPRLMTVNLHGGKLPDYRGSSPMNWALLRGESRFGISIIQVDKGVDTGDVLLDKTFAIGVDDNIRDLHALANAHFPDMLVKVLGDLATGKLSPRKQDDATAGYYPMRFPNDGLILWDQLTAQEVHNRVRALTAPYPCAYTYYKGRKVLLQKTRLRQGVAYYGEPGRVYLLCDHAMLVCAKDKTLWVTEAVFADTKTPIVEEITRYDRLLTMASFVESAVGGC